MYMISPGGSCRKWTEAIEPGDQFSIIYIYSCNTYRVTIDVPGPKGLATADRSSFLISPW